MPNPAKPDASDQAQSSTFASRRAEAEAREAAGEKPPGRSRRSAPARWVSVPVTPLSSRCWWCPMFGSKPQVVVVPSGRDEQPEPTPPSREKPPAHESRCFQPSNFANRKAAADAANATRSTERLASLGQSEYTQRDRQGNVHILPAEVFFDVDHPHRRFVKLEAYPDLIPMQDKDAVTEQVTTLPPLRSGKLSRPAVSGFSQDFREDPPPRPV